MAATAVAASVTVTVTAAAPGAPIPRGSGASSEARNLRGQHEVNERQSDECAGRIATLLQAEATGTSTLRKCASHCLLGV